MRRALLAFILLTIMLIQPVAATPISGKIAFIRNGDLWTWEAGKEQRITESGGVRAPRYSSDGRFLAFTRDDGLWVLRPGGTPRRVASTHCCPANWAPTHNTLAIADQQGVSTVRLTDEGPQPPQVLAEGWGEPSWSPDGRLIALARNTNREHFTGTAEVGLVSASGGAPRVIWKGEYDQKNWVGPATAFQWSTDQQWLSFYRWAMTASISMDDNQIVVLPVKGGGITPIGLGPMNPSYLAWSPAESTLAVTDGGGRFAWGEKRLRLLPMPPQSQGLVLTPTGYADREPVWSPAGRHLYFIRSRAQAPDLMFQPAKEQAIWVYDVKAGSQGAVPGTANALGVRVGARGHLLWPKGDGKTASLWTPAPGGAVQVVGAIDFPSYYYGQFSWGEVFDWWSGQHP